MGGLWIEGRYVGSAARAGPAWREIRFSDNEARLSGLGQANVDVTRAANFWGLKSVFVQDAERSRWRLRSTGVHSFADLGFDDNLGFLGEQQPHGTHGHAVWDRRFGKSPARVLYQGLGVSAPRSVFHVLFITR